jgi:ATPase involved in DNA repair
MCKYSKQEIKELTQKLEEIQKTSEKTAENVEKLKNSSFDDNSSNEILENLTGKLAELEEEYAELTKSSNEINFPDLDKILAPDASLKLINEFYVNVQKRLGFLDLENGNLAATLKKYSSEALKLREKCEKAAHRYKSNDELKNKLRDLEESFAKYVLLEEKLALELKQAEEEYRLHSGSLENKLDLPAAQKMLEEIEILAKKDQEDVEKLEFQLQEKRNMLRAARAYGLQRSKTSNKLRSDMELLGLVLVEKDQNISKLKREINELKMKHAQAEAEIKEINDKKNHS